MSPRSLQMAVHPDPRSDTKTKSLDSDSLAVLEGLQCLPDLLQLPPLLSLQDVLAQNLEALADGLRSCIGLHTGIQRDLDQLIRKAWRCRCQEVVGDIKVLAH